MSPLLLLLLALPAAAEKPPVIRAQAVAGDECSDAKTRAGSGVQRDPGYMEAVGKSIEAQRCDELVVLVFMKEVAVVVPVIDGQPGAYDYYYGGEIACVETRARRGSKTVLGIAIPLPGGGGGRGTDQQVTQANRIIDHSVREALKRLRKDGDRCRLAPTS